MSLVHFVCPAIFVWRIRFGTFLSSITSIKTLSFIYHWNGTSFFFSLCFHKKVDRSVYFLLLLCFKELLCLYYLLLEVFFLSSVGNHRNTFTLLWLNDYVIYAILESFYLLLYYLLPILVPALEPYNGLNYIIFLFLLVFEF